MERNGFIGNGLLLKKQKMAKFPFTLISSKIPLNVNLMFKLLAITILANSYLYNTSLKLPFLDILNEISDPSFILWTAILITMIGLFLMFINLFPSIGGFMVSLTIFISILWCRPCYADSRMYIFSLLILLTLYQKDYGIKILQIQVIILYFGSGLNKLFDLDWLTGVYIDNWLTKTLDSSLYKTLTTLTPTLMVAKFMSWSVILVEIVISIFFISKKYYKTAIWLGVFLHSSSMIVTNSVFGSFVAGVFISYLAYINWPNQIIISLPNSRNLNYISKLHSFLNFKNFYKINTTPISYGIKCSINNKEYSNFTAIQQILLYHPIFYFFIVGLILFPGLGYNWVKGIFFILISILMIPIVGKIIDRFILLAIKNKSN